MTYMVMSVKRLTEASSATSQVPVERLAAGLNDMERVGWRFVQATPEGAYQGPDGMTVNLGVLYIFHRED